MPIKQVLQTLLLFIIFMTLLLTEYFCCGVFFRFVRSSDFLKVNILCALLGFGLCYLIFYKLIKAALREKIHKALIWGFYLLFAVFLSLFFRFTLQLTNGWLDQSDADVHTVVVTDRKISAFGGSIKEGINPTAHLIDFKDENGDSYEMLVPLSFYYSVDGGSKLAISLRQGFFHLPWVDDYRTLNYKPTS